MADETTHQMPQWGLIKSQIEPVSPLSPQADLKEAVDIADVMSKIETERRDRIALDAPQAWFPASPPEAPISVPDEDGLHVSPGAAPEASPTETRSLPLESSTGTESVSQKEVRDLSPTRKPTPRILGLKRSTFLLIMALLTIIILAAIAGSLAGVLSHRNKASKKDAPNATAEVNVTSTITSISTTPTGTSTSPSDTGAARPLMSFSIHTWEFVNHTGRSQIFYTEGQYRTAFRTRAYEWQIGYYEDKVWDVCSFALCLQDSQIGWRGATPFAGNQTNWKGYEYADVINIKCGSVFADPGCPFEATSVTTAYKTAPFFTESAPTATLTGKGTTRTSASVPAKTTSSKTAVTKT